MHYLAIIFLLFGMVATGCGDRNVIGNSEVSTGIGTETSDLSNDVHQFAGGCFTLQDENGSWLRREESLGRVLYRFSTTMSEEAEPFFMQAADLGVYLLYDRDRGYVVANQQMQFRSTSLPVQPPSLSYSHVSEAEWDLNASGRAEGSYVLRHRKSGHYLGVLSPVGSIEDAAAVSLHPVEGCTEYPELTVDAEGTVQRTEFDDGDLYGIAEAHSHLFSNLAFGGGGVFHGAPFHPLGVEHALSDCHESHGNGGRKDLFGFAYDAGAATEGTDAVGLSTFLAIYFNRELPDHNHHTNGYPHFTSWPNAPTSSTHQAQYYIWLKRAWLGGMRLLVQHATSNSVICDVLAGLGTQDAPNSCNDMVAVDHIIDATYAMERYIDAQAGGPGKGFFRIVKTPAEARQVVRQGKMAVILGIEVSNLFDCFAAPRPGYPACTLSDIDHKLDLYYAKGVRAIFPVHKFDNAFSAGDGQKGFLELGNFFNSGYYANFVEQCPDLPTAFDKGSVTFSGMNRPRDDYDAPPPVDASVFQNIKLNSFLPFLFDPPLEGDYCQNAGLTNLGIHLILGMMKRGMVIELDHFPRRAYERAFTLLQYFDYPAAGTHGLDNRGRLYALGGISTYNPGLPACRDANHPTDILAGLKARIASIEHQGGYPGTPLGFDLGGFAGAPGPRFGGSCPTPQQDPVTYPFQSYAGDVTFTQPRVGQRTLDFNTEGLVHVGLLPEILDDLRRGATDDTDLEPIFRSAEAYIRMWEKAERRAEVIRTKD